MDLLNTKIEMLHTELLEENIGQINDVPANPRTITKQEYRKLKKSIREDNLLGAKPLNVYPADKKYIVLDGNQRLKAVKDLKLKEVPCIILPDSTPKKVLRKIVILSNSHAGEWNVEMLTNAWNSQELDDWSLRIPEWEGVKIDNQSENPEDADIAEQLGYKTSVYKTQCLNNNNALHNTDREKSECVLLIKKTKHKQNKSR